MTLWNVTKTVAILVLVYGTLLSKTNNVSQSYPDLDVVKGFQSLLSFTVLLVFSRRVYNLVFITQSEQIKGENIELTKKIEMKLQRNVNFINLLSRKIVSNKVLNFEPATIYCCISFSVTQHSKVLPSPLLVFVYETSLTNTFI